MFTSRPTGYGREAKKGVQLGTSIMAVAFDGGVVMGADSRTSLGSYVSNRVSDKLTPVHKRVFCCRSGSAADTQAVARNVTYMLNFHAVETGGLPRVKTAAMYFRDMCYDYKNYLSASIIVAGWDPKEGGSVYCIPPGGACVKQPFAIGGSGSVFIYGLCDAKYKRGMSKDEALQFVRTSLAFAMSRDGSSGGTIRTVVISKDGVERDFIPGDKLPVYLEHATSIPKTLSKQEAVLPEPVNDFNGSGSSASGVVAMEDEEKKSQ